MFLFSFTDTSLNFCLIFRLSLEIKKLTNGSSIRLGKRFLLCRFHNVYVYRYIC